MASAKLMPDYTLQQLPYRENSLEYAQRLQGEKHFVFLDSGVQPHPQRRYDILSANPRRVFSARDHHALSDLTCFFAQQAAACRPIDELPFCGGLIGFVSYDAGQDDELATPAFWYGFYDWALILDHMKQRCWLLHSKQHTSNDISRIRNLLLSDKAPSSAPFRLKQEFRSNTSYAEYVRAFNTIADYISAGDCYQINYAMRLHSRFSGSPWSMFRVLRQDIAGPYSAYIDTGQNQLLSFSPERFLSAHRQQVQTKPIKGTRPRGETEAEDHNYRQQLLSSSKDRAENLMIVDLLRNDLGRCCTPGSIQVEQLFALETFPNVHHLVSTISGNLREDQNHFDLLRACFPGGSITGAPKIRAMQIIRELENSPRSVYCGSLGYISLNGRMDSNIIIRSLLCQDEDVYCWAGSGVVADSNLNEEYQECYDKISRILSSLEAHKDDKHNDVA